MDRKTEREKHRETTHSILLTTEKMRAPIEAYTMLRI